jgi:hypothetical protein
VGHGYQEKRHPFQVLSGIPRMLTSLIYWLYYCIFNTMSGGGAGGPMVISEGWGRDGRED